MLGFSPLFVSDALLIFTKFRRLFLPTQRWDQPCQEWQDLSVMSWSWLRWGSGDLIEMWFKSLREFGRQWENNHILNLYFIGYTLRHTWTASNVRTTDPSSKTTSNPCIPTTRPTLILAAQVKRAGCQNDSVKIDLPPGNELENETKLLLITKWLKEERPS